MALPSFADLVWTKTHINRTPRVVDVTGAAPTTPLGRTLARRAHGVSNFRALTLNRDCFGGRPFAGGGESLNSRWRKLDRMRPLERDKEKQRLVFRRHPDRLS